MQKLIFIVSIIFSSFQLLGLSSSAAQTKLDTVTTTGKVVINQDECGDPLTESMLWTSIEGEVDKVSNNHILDLLLKNGRTVKVLLAMITFPETNDSINALSSETLMALIFHKKGEVLIDPFHNDSTRTIGRVFAHSKEVNLILLEKGLASFYTSDSSQYFGWYIPCVYRKAEQLAKQKGYGIWQTNKTLSRPNQALKLTE